MATDVRLAAELLAAVDAQRLSAEVLDRALASQAPHVRRSAALAIGQSRTLALRPRLHALLADPDTGVAANAAFAAGLLVDTSAVPSLARALARGSSVAVECAWALGEIGEPARDALAGALAAAARSSGAPTEAADLLLAAAKLRPVPVAAVAPHARSPLAVVREAAAYAVGRSRAPAGVRLLLDLAADANAATRASVARGLARSATGDSLAPPSVAALARLVADSSAAVRIAAVRSLASHGRPAAALVAPLWRDTVPHVRVAAAESAGELLGSATAGAWSAVWNADSAHGFRRALLAAGALHGRLGAESRAWAGDTSWRRRAASAAAAPRGAAVVAALTPLLRDPDARVRAAAYGSLGRDVDSAATPAVVRDLVAGALSDSDAVVRGVALSALGGSPRGGEANVVRLAYVRAAADRDNDARLAALRFLAKLWRTDSAAIPADERARLRALPRPADPLERAAAAGLPAAAGWPATAPARSLASYDSVVRSHVLPAIAGRSPRAVVATARGPVTIELHAREAPLTVENFVSLARRGYFAGTRFHRVVPAFVAQDGDPRGDGNGGAGYAIRDEQNRVRYRRGVVGMALSGPNTGGSQYFVTLTDQPHLTGHYTAFGHVVAGFAALDRVVEGDQIDSVWVER